MCDRDTYIYDYYPSLNYGGSDYVFVGNRVFGSVEALYHFDISSAPSGWYDAKIVVDFYYASSTVNVAVCVISNSWNEMTVTWTNAPSHGTSLGYILNGGDPFTIPATDIIQDNQIAIGLYGQGGASDGYLQGSSKEGAWSDDRKPSIILTYEGINPTLILPIILGTSVFLAIIGYAIFVVVKRRRSRLPAPLKPQQPIQQARTASLKFCSECGQNLQPNATFCTNCGKKLV